MSSEPTKKAVTSYMVKLYQSLSVQDIAWLSRWDEFCGNNYRIDDGPVRAVEVQPGELPWPVCLLLGTYSRKHRFGIRKPISLKQIYEATADLGNRVEWLWKLAGTEAQEKCRIWLMGTRPHPYWGEVVPGEVDGFTDALKKAVVSEVVKANRRIPWMRGLDRPLFARYAVKWLASNGLRAVLSDKDGVFVVLRDVQLARFMAQQMTPARYKLLPRDHLVYEVERVRRASFSLCDRIRRFGCADLAQAATRPLEARQSRAYACRLSCTTKTHKPAGKVAARVIHSSIGLGFNGLSTILNLWCSEKLSGLDVLCLNSQQTIRKVTSVSLPPDACLVKLDVKDFFMDGDHSVLAQIAGSFFVGPQRQIVEDLVLHLCFYQFVTDGVDFWSVIKGTGMGMITAHPCLTWCSTA